MLHCIFHCHSEKAIRPFPDCRDSRISCFETCHVCLPFVQFPKKIFLRTPCWCKNTILYLSNCYLWHFCRFNWTLLSCLLCVDNTSSSHELGTFFKLEWFISQSYKKAKIKKVKVLYWMSFFLCVNWVKKQPTSQDKPSESLENCCAAWLLRNRGHDSRLCPVRQVNL